MQHLLYRRLQKTRTGVETAVKITDYVIHRLNTDTEGKAAISNIPQWRENKGSPCTERALRTKTAKL